MSGLIFSPSPLRSPTTLAVPTLEPVQFLIRRSESAGLPPKLFARITRFQRLVHTLLSTDVAHWAGASSASGFYDQAHMINEFRSFAGAPPTSFFRPHGMDGSAGSFVVRGRPSEWSYGK